MRQNVSTVRSSAMPLSRTMRAIQAYTSFWCCRNSASKASRSPAANRSSSSICHSLYLLTRFCGAWLQEFCDCVTTVDESPKTGRKNGLKSRHYTRPGMSVGGYNLVADLDCFGRTCQVRLFHHGNQSFTQG